MTRLRTHFAFRVDTWTTALCHIDALAEEVWNEKPRMGGDPTVYRKALTSLPTHGTFMTSTNVVIALGWIVEAVGRLSRMMVSHFATIRTMGLVRLHGISPFRARPEAQ